MRHLFWTIYAVCVRLRRGVDGARLRMHARRVIVTRTPKAFVSYPEPKAPGAFARGQQMMNGNFRVAGQLIEAPGRAIWAISADPLVVEELHGCAWVDDMAAIATPEGRRRLQAWVAEWIRLYGSGSGLGWRPDLTGQRLIHWISHAITIMQGQDKSATSSFLRSVARQARFLGRTWRMAPHGLPRIRALCGLVYAGLALEGGSAGLARILSRLGKECARTVGPDGAIANRSPEELAEVFALLVWAARAVEEAGQIPDAEHLTAIERIAPTLRLLRLGDGALVRFHGGGRGDTARLDQALADGGVRTGPDGAARMGFARLATARTVVVVDCAPPPTGAASVRAQAATLAFEMSSGRDPMIVNTGPGRNFGSEWSVAARASACQSTLVLADTSSAQLWERGLVAATLGARLVQGPRHVTEDRARDATGLWLLGSHDGYARSFGLTHDRRLFLAPDGRELRGEDTVFARDAKAKRRHAAALAGHPDNALPFAIHFHLHPDVLPSLDMGGHAVSLQLPNDEIWVFRQSGGTVSLEEAVFLDQNHINPRGTKQIVVRGQTDDAHGQVTWALTRTRDGNRHNLAAAELAELTPLV